MSEGRKMWLSVMAVFLVYATFFIILKDYDWKLLSRHDEGAYWHLLLLSLAVMALLGFLLYRYARRMDERISLEQAAKENRVRRELTQNIAHELKTPVASILGYTETILDNPGLSDDVRRQFIVRTHSQAQRLTALLQDISTLNKMDYAPELLKMERVDVSALFADIVEETALAVGRRRMSLHNCLPSDIVVRGNPSLLYSIFRNLLDNAVNYAGEGTTVEVSAVQQQNHWHFTVSDDGAGIPAEHLPRIFERFYRIEKGRSREMGGTGLGLSIVKNAVLLHGGTITVHSPSTGGLSFRFTLRI